MCWEQWILESVRVAFDPTRVSYYLLYYPAVPIGFMEQSDILPLAPTRLKKRQVEVIAMMVADERVVGPPKAKVARLKKSMMIVDAKTSTQSWSWHFEQAFIGIGCPITSSMIGYAVVGDRK